MSMTFCQDSPTIMYLLQKCLSNMIAEVTTPTNSSSSFSRNGIVSLLFHNWIISSSITSNMFTPFILYSSSSIPINSMKVNLFYRTDISKIARWGETLIDIGSLPTKVVCPSGFKPYVTLIIHLIFTESFFGYSTQLLNLCRFLYGNRQTSINEGGFEPPSLTNDLLW